MPAALKLTGQRFGRLVAIEDVGLQPPFRLWRCRCDCGGECEVTTNKLRRGATASCGCLRRDTTAALKFRHGQARQGQKTRLYRTWKGIHGRCQNPNLPRYQDYGGRGIRVSDEWATFEPFRDWAMANGYSDALTIDRKDVNGPYSPANCRWVTSAAQAANKRCSVWVVYEGEKMILAEAARRSGLEQATIRRRMLSGWPQERLFSEPQSQGGHHEAFRGLLSTNPKIRGPG